ncbi:NADP-dependent oxidoreductase [Gordonia terrae]
MVALTNRQIVLRRRPVGLPSAGDFAMGTSAIPVIGDGQVLIRTLYASVDPAQRGWVLESKNYVPSVPVGSVMRSFGVGEVIESHAATYAPGDIVAGLTGWQEWAAVAEEDIHRKVDPSQEPVSTAVGILGLTGLTAYVGMLEICRPTAGSTVVVSTAAGSVGSAAGQLAAMKGARTVGLTGDDKKVRQCLEEFGFDACINYKTSRDLSADLAAACPGGIDGYFDSVGGAMLDAVLDHINVNARVAICGTISQLGDARPTGPRVERQLLVQRATMQGFLASDSFDRSAHIASVMAGWLRDGQLRYREEVLDGLEHAPYALERLLAGHNSGKVVVKVGS